MKQININGINITFIASSEADQFGGLQKIVEAGGVLAIGPSDVVALNEMARLMTSRDFSIAVLLALTQDSVETGLLLLVKEYGPDIVSSVIRDMAAVRMSGGVITKMYENDSPAVDTFMDLPEQQHMMDVVHTVVVITN